MEQGERAYKFRYGKENKLFVEHFLAFISHFVGLAPLEYIFVPAPR